MQAGEPQEEVDCLGQAAKTMKPYNCWKLPNSYHVTSMFIGGNKQKL